MDCTGKQVKVGSEAASERQYAVHWPGLYSGTGFWRKRGQVVFRVRGDNTSTQCKQVILTRPENHLLALRAGIGVVLVLAGCGCLKRKQADSVQHSVQFSPQSSEEARLGGVKRPDADPMEAGDIAGGETGREQVRQRFPHGGRELTFQ
jgi:hypothetical protein